MLTISPRPRQFYAEAEEADKWMRERKPLLTSSDIGKDRDAVTSLIKKLDIVERDISNYNQVRETDRTGLKPYKVKVEMVRQAVIAGFFPF